MADGIGPVDPAGWATTISTVVAAVVGVFAGGAGERAYRAWRKVKTDTRADRRDERADGVADGLVERVIAERDEQRGRADRFAGELRELVGQCARLEERVEGLQRARETDRQHCEAELRHQARQIAGLVAALDRHGVVVDPTINPP